MQVFQPQPLPTDDGQPENPSSECETSQHKARVPPPDVADRIGDHLHRTRMWGTAGRLALATLFGFPTACGVGYLAWSGIVRKDQMNAAPTLSVDELSLLALKQRPFEFTNRAQGVTAPRFIRVPGWAVAESESIEVRTNRNTTVEHRRITSYRLTATPPGADATTPQEVSNNLQDLRTPSLKFVVRRSLDAVEGPFELLPRHPGEARAVVITLSNRPKTFIKMSNGPSSIVVQPVLFSSPEETELDSSR